MRRERCGSEVRDGTREVVLVFLRKELLYDIRNYCYIEGHIMETENAEARHTLQDVGETGNIDRVIRILDVAHLDIVERLYPYTKREITREVQDDRLKEKGTYGIVLMVPEGMSQTTVNLLEELIHETLVSVVMSDWLSITNTQKAAVWREKSEALYSRISTVMMQRRNRVRLRKHWLG